MKLVTDRPYSDPEKAARKIVEIANSTEAVQDGKIYIEPLLCKVGEADQIRMSQDELGRALDVSFQQIQKYEKGVNRLSSGRLVELAATLQCSAADLIGGSRRPRPRVPLLSLRRLEGRRCNQRDGKNLKSGTPAARHQPR